MNQGNNFGMPYPVYPQYQGMMPNMMPSPTIFNNDCSNNDNMSKYDKKIDNLEKRVSSIENYINNLNPMNTYNSSNYQML